MRFGNLVLVLIVSAATLPVAPLFPDASGQLGPRVEVRYEGATQNPMVRFTIRHLKTVLAQMDYAPGEPLLTILIFARGAWHTAKLFDSSSRVRYHRNRR